MSEPKKKRVSKKTRKAWRKHVDTKDVDIFLEKARQDERIGNFTSKKDIELFKIDTKPTPQPKSVKRMLLKSQEPKCFAILSQRSAIPDPISKRNRVRSKEERMNPLLRKKIALRKANGILTRKEKQALKDKLQYLEKLKQKKKEERVNFKQDVWEEDSNDRTADSKWMTSDTLRHTLAHCGITKRQVPTLIKKKQSVLPAIEPPHEGTSYNPSYTDHQNLLRQVAEKQLNLEKEEAHLDRVTSKMFCKLTTAENEENRIQELTEGLPMWNSKEQNDESDQNEGRDGNLVKSVNPAVKREKKTRQQRRKQREQKDLLKRQQEKKIEKKKITDIYRMRFIAKQLAKTEEKQSAVQEKRLAKNAEKVKETKKLGKLKFEKSEPDFAMPTEIAGNLRNTAPIGNLLRDRFKSLQERNLLAPSTLKKREKAKIKRFIKPDHKIDVNKIK